MNAINETYSSEELQSRDKNIDERRFDPTSSKYLFSIKRQGTSVWIAVFILRLNTDSDGDKTRGGKLFQMRAAVTGNGWSPIVECFERGMTSATMSYFWLNFIMSPQ